MSCLRVQVLRSWNFVKIATLYKVSEHADVLCFFNRELCQAGSVVELVDDWL